MNNKREKSRFAIEAWQDFKENFSKDFTAGFIVFLLALPLSLGIAGASGFPPIMGVISAIIGGIVGSLLTGSQLAIKGPAAGLIVIVAGAVSEFGGGTDGWTLTLGVLLVASVLQIIFGLLKWGRFVDLFPLSAVHGMLAAIGLIIIAKQVPVLLNVNPSLSSGKGPLELFASIPHFIANLQPSVAIVGVVSLMIMLLWPMIKPPILKTIPAPLLVLLFAIPASIYLDLNHSGSDWSLVKVGSLAQQIGINIRFDGISQTGVFVKYVIMVALVGSLESLLTVKAIDIMDPWKRKSNPNKDIIAVGAANAITSVLGGFPMISEVARSSANVANGGKTRWANFYHGLFLLISALLIYPILELIPNAALAAMLIAVGINLAHPREFIHTYKKGVEQLAIFITTIFFTLFEDLLVGIAAGMLLKLIIHVFRGASPQSLFISGAKLKTNINEVVVEFGEAAVFTNYLGSKKILMEVPVRRNLKLDFTNSVLIDHSVMENLHKFEADYVAKGGTVSFLGLEHFDKSADHPLSAHKRSDYTALKPKTPWESSMFTDVEFDERKLLEKLNHFLPSQAALKDFVHHNSLHAFENLEFFKGIFSASKIFGMKVTFNINEYRKLYEQGRIRESIVHSVIARKKGEAGAAEWKDKMINGAYESSGGYRIGKLRKAWKKEHHFDLDNAVQPLLFRIISSYLDQGISLWHFPFEDKGLLTAIRTLEANSFTSFFTSKRAKSLLSLQNLSMEMLLKILVGKSAYFEQYVLDQQFGHPGWSGLVNAIENQPDTLLYQKEICLKDFICLEMLLEIDALDQALGLQWEPICADYDSAPQDYFEEVVLNETDEVMSLWQEAFEWDYYDSVLSGVKLAAKAKSPRTKIPSFQAMFCLDDRECSIRRHMEYVDTNCVTYGTVGFFGVAIYFQPFDGKFYEKNCPVALTPMHLIQEIETSIVHKKEVYQHKISHTFMRGFLLSLSTGLGAGVRMLMDLFNPKMRPDIADAFSHMDIDGELLIEAQDDAVRKDGLKLGYTVSEMTEVVLNLLTGMDLIENFSNIVFVVAHGSSSANNPHHGAHDCGACSGRPGAVNARVFASMANHIKVRENLKNHQIDIPPSTQFIGAMHDTASDEIRYYDTDILTKVNQIEFDTHRKTVENALDLNAKERARRFASIDITKSLSHIRNEIKKRSVSYFEPRPELGHGTNALCFIGSGDILQGLFLDRRAFLQSYNYLHDPQGETLLKVLAPLPFVCGGINLEYYFSRMDIERMGAGTKLPHNVNGLIGVTNSADGDMRPGLPLQMVENHDPVRLLMMVEHFPEIVLTAITSSESMYNWFDKNWIHLAVISPVDGEIYHFNNGKFELYQPISNAEVTNDILSLIEQTPSMRTNHILDATKENIPVNVINRITK